MANTLSVMTNVLRNVVSKQRIRYKEKGFNLDLAYICDNIIAMGYPADNIESFYRNRIEDVYKFLEENHHDHYKIYNLCLERSYDINKFHGRVAVYPFEDHNPPTIKLIQQFCYDVDCWLKSHSSNVAAIHCKAGKGRTGTMICCYLLYSGLQSTAEDALACYDEKRTKDRKGVTIPSQRRYVHYFANLIQSGLQYEKRILQFCEIRFEDANLLYSHGIVNCSVSVLQETSSEKIQNLQTYTIDFRKNLALQINSPLLLVSGDIKIELTHKTSRKKIFHFWLNTYFVLNTAEIEDDGKVRKLIYTLQKNEIDDAHKDREHKCFSEDFKVQVIFLPMNDFEDINTGFNTLQEIESRLSYEVSEESNSTKYKSMLAQNYSRSSDLNFIGDQKSSLNVCACGVRTNIGSRCTINKLVQKCTCDAAQSSNTISNNSICNNTIDTNEEAISKISSERIPNLIPSIPPSCYQLEQSLPLNVSAPKPSENHEMNEEHKQLGLKKIAAKQNERLQEQLQNATPNRKARRISNLEQTGSFLSKNERNEEENTTHNTISKGCSSSSSNSSSSVAVDNEEDWESGESSSKLLELKALNLSTASNLKKQLSFNVCNDFGSNCLEVFGENNDKPESCSRIVQNNLALDIRKVCYKNMDTKYNMLQIQPLEEQVHQDLVKVYNAQSPKLRYVTVAEATNNQNFLFKRNSYKASYDVKSSLEVFQGSALSCFSSKASSSNNGSSFVSTSNQKLKTKLKKNKIKLSQKFEWFHKYFRNDPVDFCETFVQQTTIMRRNSSSGNRNFKLSTLTQLSSGCFPELSSSSPFFVGEKLDKSCLTDTSRHVAPYNVSLQNKNIALASQFDSSLSNADNYDFYSSVCEKQLSFNNSPCKSPRSLVNSCYSNKKSCFMSDKQIAQNNTTDAGIDKMVIIAAKPIKTLSIGFNVGGSASTHPENLIKSESFSQINATGLELNNSKKNSFNKDSSEDLSSLTNSYYEHLAKKSENINSSALPFIFPQMDKELNYLEAVRKTVEPLEKNGEETLKSNQSTLLNFIIMNDGISSPDSFDGQLVPVKEYFENESQNTLCHSERISTGVVDDIIISSSSNKYKSDVSIDESCTNCKCNLYSLDLEPHICKTTQLVIDKPSKTCVNEKNILSKRGEVKNFQE